MTDAPAAPPAGSTPPPPAAAGTPPAAVTPPAGDAPVQVTRPDWLPEAHWDPQASAIKPEFGQHYAEVTKFYQDETAKREALAARKPEDIKFEIKLPDTVKVPEGMQVKIDENDPRIPVIREMALKNGWDQDTVNGLVALDAQQKIQAHNAEMERLSAEDAKLGANGKDRKAAVAAWVSNLKDITPDEKAEIGILTATAAGVSLVEKLMAKAAGAVPGVGDPPPPPAPTTRVEDRLYPNLARKVN